MMPITRRASCLRNESQKKKSSIMLVSVGLAVGCIITHSLCLTSSCIVTLTSEFPNRITSEAARGILTNEDTSWARGTLAEPVKSFNIGIILSLLLGYFDQFASCKFLCFFYGFIDRVGYSIFNDTVDGYFQYLLITAHHYADTVFIYGNFFLLKCLLHLLCLLL